MDPHWLEAGAMIVLNGFVALLVSVVALKVKNSALEMKHTMTEMALNFEQKINSLTVSSRDWADERYSLEKQCMERHEVAMQCAKAHEQLLDTIKSLRIRTA